MGAILQGFSYVHTEGETRCQGNQKRPCSYPGCCTVVPFGQGFKDMSPPTKESYSYYPCILYLIIRMLLRENSLNMLPFPLFCGNI